jgi:hypothetical protein
MPEEESLGCIGAAARNHMSPGNVHTAKRGTRLLEARALSVGMDAFQSP